jgi:CheY-like chemotaxis protein
MADARPAEGPAILLVAPDDALRYLMERYASRGGFLLRALADGTSAESDYGQAGSAGADGRSPAVVWVSSIQALESLRLGEHGQVSADTPLIVLASDGEATRAHELGADHRVAQPFTYDDFLAALTAVGVTR